MTIPTLASERQSGSMELAHFKSKQTPEHTPSESTGARKDF